MFDSLIRKKISLSDIFFFFLHANIKRIVLDVYILTENKVFKKKAEINVSSKFMLKNIFLSKAKKNSSFYVCKCCLLSIITVKT